MKNVNLVLAFIAAAFFGVLAALVYTKFFFEPDQQILDSSAQQEVDLDQVWEAGVRAELFSYTAHGQTYVSSGTAEIQWQVPQWSVDHYVVSAIDGVSDMETRVRVEQMSARFDGLKSDTEYTFTVTACGVSDCSDGVESEEVEIRTGEEYWQIEGEGASYEDAVEVVEHGSTLSYVLPYGDWAPADLQGVVKYYYNAMPSPGQGFEGGIRVAASDEGYDVFEDVKALFLRECHEMGQQGAECPEQLLEMFAFQVVPLMSGKVRLFFEASSPADEDHLTRIYSLDSQDGYEGEDFNRAVDSDVCGDGEQWDLIEDGDCEPELLIGSEEAGERSWLNQARQHKIGYPKMDSWLWDEAPGTFMIVTGEDECGYTRDGLFYAVWDGSDWLVEQEDGCATPLVSAGHGPVVVHMGEARYKVYYEMYDYVSGNEGAWESKPTQVLYADGLRTGDENVVELADWEDEDLAREIHFLWPDGTLLTDDEEAGLGDHVIWLPEQSLEEQVMYMNLGGFDNPDWKKASAGLGMARLVNP